MRYARFRDPAGSVRTGEYGERTVRFGGAEYSHDEVEFLPPSEPTKVVCVGRNYAPHAEERGADLPERPLLFLKPPNALAAHGDTVVAPAGAERLDHEAELGVVIGDQCRHVAAADAADVIAGYTCVDDLSNRDDQRRERNWVRGKAFDNACPLGPCVATPDELPADAEIELRVNGNVRQSGNVSDLVFSVPELVAEITTHLTLEPGDVIATGTPAGVGNLEDDDAVAIEIEGVGTLEHDVERP